MKSKYYLTIIVLFILQSSFCIYGQGPGFTVTPETANISENGGTINLYVVLNTAPASDVVIDLISSNVDNVIISTSTLLFTPSNWNTTQAVLATGVNDDFNRDGDNSTIVISVNASLSDPIFGALADQSVVINCLDDDTSIRNQIDFNTTNQLTDLFNPDSSPVFTNLPDQGINGTGSINVPLGTSDIWTYKKGFSVSPTEHAVYTFSAFFKILGENGRGGLGFTNNPANEPDVVYGAPENGLGMAFHGGGGEFVNNRATNFVLWPSGFLQVGNWYKMIFKITSNPGTDNFDVEFWIYNADAYGNIGSLFANNTAIFTNTIMASSDVIYVYFSAAGTRMEKIDDYEFEIGGATSVIEEGHPVVLGYEVSNTTSSEMTAGGNVTNDGGTSVFEKGIVYGTDPNPTTDANKINLGNGIGLFSTTISALEPNTTYFVRAYAINGTGTSYGAQKIVTTLGTPSIKLSKSTMDVGENGGTNTFLVSLGGQPPSNVTLSILSNDTSEATIAPASLHFGPGNWDIPQVVTVTGIDDNTITDDTAELTLSVATALSDNSYDAVPDSIVEITLINDDFDSDGDGVYDALDQCAATPSGENVDVNGCSDSQKDTDSDGVNDALDQCPATPLGETVDADGCSDSQEDTDGDGVYDGLDQCAATPSGENVDINGCSDSQKDSDGDGVNDHLDQCPNTPTGETIDTNGCSDSQKDADGDGINDDLDQCPNTPSGESVDVNGCSDSQKDTDGDGVNDALDQCPNTPSGESVDVNGCSDSQKDTDGDSVNDALDVCPNTPTGETVDVNGCSDSQKDTDGDGVNDALDQCPNTPSGESVDVNGCSDSQKDTDGDGTGDSTDNCPNTPNPDQADLDEDGLGDICDDDIDGDGTPNDEDAFPDDPTEDIDTDGDGTGDNTDGDIDGDGIPNEDDAFPYDALPDTDGDGVIDSLDQCPDTPSGATVDANGCSVDQVDSDGDGIPDVEDNCPETYNPGQEDRDGDGLGDVCDTVELNVSQAFTPNGDGVNDTWVIYNIENYPNSLVRVFNAWGKEVLSVRNYQNDWDGRYKDFSNKLPDAGSYYYQIDFDGDGSVDQDGWLYITSR